MFAYCGLFSLGLYGLYTIVVFFFAMLIRAVVVYRVMSSFSLVGKLICISFLGWPIFLFIFIISFIGFQLLLCFYSFYTFTDFIMILICYSFDSFSFPSPENFQRVHGRRRRRRASRRRGSSGRGRGLPPPEGGRRSRDQRHSRRPHLLPGRGEGPEGRLYHRRLS